MNQIILFLFEDKHVVRAIEEKTILWFVVPDICKILGIQNQSATLQYIGDGHKKLRMIDTSLGKREAWCVTDLGLAMITFRARGAKTVGTLAYRFRIWVENKLWTRIHRVTSEAQLAAIAKMRLVDRMEVLPRHRENITDGQLRYHLSHYVTQEQTRPSRNDLVVGLPFYDSENKRAYFVVYAFLVYLKTKRLSKVHEDTVENVLKKLGLEIHPRDPGDLDMVYWSINPQDLCGERGDYH